jgi:hypothetical protein
MRYDDTSRVTYEGADMKKLIIVLVGLILVFSSILPVSALLIRQGFRKPQAEWAPKVVYFGARLRMRIFRYGSARVILEKALQTWPQYEKVDEGTYWVGFCYEKSGADAQALTWYRTFLQRWPSHRWSEQAKRRIDMLEAENL